MLMLAREGLVVIFPFDRLFCSTRVSPTFRNFINEFSTLKDRVYRDNGVLCSACLWKAPKITGWNGKSEYFALDLSNKKGLLTSRGPFRQQNCSSAAACGLVILPWKVGRKGVSAKHIIHVVTLYEFGKMDTQQLLNTSLNTRNCWMGTANRFFYRKHIC